MAETHAAVSVAEKAEGVTRRQFLNYAWLASLGLLTVQIAGVSYLFAMPRFREGEFGGVFTLGPASQMPAVGAAPVPNDEGKFWLVQTEQGLLALYKVCTHLGCLYGWADTEDKFICPCHGSQFHRDGTYIQGPAPRSLDRFALSLQDTAGATIAETDSEGNPVPVVDANTIVRVDTGQRILGKRRG